MCCIILFRYSCYICNFCLTTSPLSLKHEREEKKRRKKTIRAQTLNHFDIFRSSFQLNSILYLVCVCVCVNLFFLLLYARQKIAEKLITQHILVHIFTFGLKAANSIPKNRNFFHIVHSERARMLFFFIVIFVRSFVRLTKFFSSLKLAEEHQFLFCAPH